MTTLSEGASAMTTPFHSAFGIFVDNKSTEEVLKSDQTKLSKETC
jgi:hypothetical protein